MQRRREYARFVLAFTIRSFVARNFVRACVKDRLHKILIMTQEKEHKKKLKTEYRICIKTPRRERAGDACSTKRAKGGGRETKE